MNIIPESIILTVYNKDASSYAVTWQTQDKGDPILEYRQVGAEEFITVSGETDDCIGLTKNFAVMPNLSYNTEYQYRVGDKEGTRSETFTFRTVRNLENELSFYYFTDSQDESYFGNWWLPGWRHARENFPEVDFVLHGGDFVQMSGNPDHWRQMLEVNKPYVTSLPFIACNGNHDYWGCYLYGYRHTFAGHVSYDLPPQNTENGIYYSCVIGNTHFIAMNSGAGIDEESEQYKWVLSELSSSKSKWKIVLIHNPMYSPGKYGSRPGLNDLAMQLRGLYNPLFEKYGVDMVFSGHDHVYSKSFPILADGNGDKEYQFEYHDFNGESVKTVINPRGPIHFISGPAGNQDRSCHDGVDTSYFVDFDEYEDTAYAHVCYSYVQIKDDTLCLIYKMVSVESGEAVLTKSFAIKKEM